MVWKGANHHQVPPSLKWVGSPLTKSACWEPHSALNVFRDRTSTISPDNLFHCFTTCVGISFVLTECKPNSSGHLLQHFLSSSLLQYVLKLGCFPKLGNQSGEKVCFLILTISSYLSNPIKTVKCIKSCLTCHVGVERVEIYFDQ